MRKSIVVKNLIKALVIVLVLLQGFISVSVCENLKCDFIPGLRNQSDGWAGYSVEKMDDEYQLFSNHIDGYEIKLPADMHIDMSCADICAVAYNDNTKIEIYRQNLAGKSVAGYIAYSNKFASDSFIETITSEYINSDESIYLFIWKREKLKKLDNDMNYYASIDIADENGDMVFSILVKTTEEIKGYEDIEYLISSFKPSYRISEGSEYVKTELTNLAMRGWNKETKSFYEKYLSGVTSGLTWGLFEPDTATFKYSTLKDYEEKLEYEFPVIVNYTQITDPSQFNVAERLKMAWNEGKVLELTFQMTPLDAGNMMYEVLNGVHDEFLENYAKTIADFGHPVLFRPLNEMNGDWCIYSAYHTCKDTEVYKAVYRYIYDIFRKHGALANTIWVWNPNSKSYPDFKWNDAFMYYPGDEYVDVVGMTAYNTGAFYFEQGETWTEFEDLYGELYKEYSQRYAQPLIITEFACADFGGDKVAWMKEMFRVISGYDRIRMAIWWDGCDRDVYGNVARSYFLDSSDKVFDTFRKGIHGEYDNALSPADSRGSFSSAYEDEVLAEMLNELSIQKEEALKAGTTVEEYLGTGRADTRPSWLEHKRDGSWGYSEEMLNEFQNNNN